MTAEVAKGIGYGGIGDGLIDKANMAKGVGYSLLGPPTGLSPFIFAVLEFISSDDLPSSNTMTDADVATLQFLMESE